MHKTDVWMRIDALDPDDTIHVIERGPGYLCFAILNNPRHDDLAAVVWGCREIELIKILDAPSDDILKAHGLST